MKTKDISFDLFRIDPYTNKPIRERKGTCRTISYISTIIIRWEISDPAEGEVRFYIIKKNEK